MVFRETPYTDMRCTRPLTKQETSATKHFELDYDSSGKLVELRYSHAGKLRAFSDRFVRAPRITIHYEGNQEIRRFYNEWSTRALVSGDVYEARFTLDNKGKRKELIFYGLDGKPVDNDFNISRYTWQTRDDGEVIEHRYNVKGDLIRNRPGFGYIVTRFAYDANGLLTRMYNLGEEGQNLTPDEAGIAMTQISYDKHGQFTGWLNLDMEGKPKRGMSNIAEIRYIPSKFSGEQIATFNDSDGTPQMINWGAHKVTYDFDAYGNAVNRLHFGLKGEPVNSSSGIGQIKSTWTKNGAHQLSDRYFDNAGKPVASSYSGVHAVLTTLDENGRPSETSYMDLAGNIITHKGQGYATESFEYDQKGRLISRKFMAPDKTLANHGTWGVARFEYRYFNDGRLRSAQSFTATGEEKKATWNPAH